MNIYVGNLANDCTERELRELFAEHGIVASVTIIRDRIYNVSKGFGFVEMPDKTQAMTAISALNKRIYIGRALEVNIAKPRE